MMEMTSAFISWIRSFPIKLCFVLNFMKRKMNYWYKHRLGISWTKTKHVPCSERMATQCILAVLAVPIKTIVLIWNPWEAPLEAITERGLGRYPHQLINMVHLRWLPWLWKILAGFASSRRNIYISISSGTKVVSIILKLASAPGIIWFGWNLPNYL